MGERAGWQDWRCPDCGRRWGLEHYYSEDGKTYVGCSGKNPAETVGISAGGRNYSKDLCAQHRFLPGAHV
jgi:hypothetical protein